MSKDLPWFRMYSEAVDDEKLRLLAFEDRWHFVAILCCKAKGIFDEPNSEMLRRKVALKLGLSVDELLVVAGKLSSVGLLDAETFQPSMEHVYTSSADLRPSGSVWARVRSAIFARDDYTCQYCGDRGKKLECDHVVPVAKGGGHEESNLVTACLPCNRAKRDKWLHEWRPV